MTAEQVSWIRLMVPDTAGENQIFSDEEIEVFISNAGGVTKSALADVLEAIVGNYLWLHRVTVTADDGKVDASGMAKYLTERVVRLRAEAGDSAYPLSFVGGETTF